MTVSVYVCAGQGFIPTTSLHEQCMVYMSLRLFTRLAYTVRLAYSEKIMATYIPFRCVGRLAHCALTHADA